MSRAQTLPPQDQAPTPSRDSEEHSVIIGLSAVVIAVTDDTPKVLVVRRPYAPLQSGAAGEHHFMDAEEERQSPWPESGDWLGLPFGPFDPALHRTLEIGLRSWVEEQTDLQVGYVEQLYTFGDRGRYATLPGQGPRVVSVGYLALAQEVGHPVQADGAWDDWYHYFPWEDWREGPPPMIGAVIRPCLERWTAASQSEGQRTRRWDRVRVCFGLDGIGWDEEKVLERYELLYEAGLAPEALRDRAERARAEPGLTGAHPLPDPALLDPGLVGPDTDPAAAPGAFGAPMQFDHRRILATAMGRLRSKLKYRPVVFELMAGTFTLLELQRTVEAIAGIRVHKQNFRRLVERSGLVEGTGQMIQTGGRPAEAFRFRRELLRERSVGVRLSRFRVSTGT